MKKWYAGMAVVVFMLVATVVFAQAPGPGPGGRPSASDPGSFRGPGPHWGAEGFEPGYGPWFRGRFGDGNFAGLSKEQIEKMQALRDRFFNETRDLRYDMAQKRLEMRKLFMDPKTDDAALLAKQKEISVLRQRLQDKMAQMMIEGRKILTPEQLQKLDRTGAGPGGRMGWGGMGFGMGRGMMGPMAGGMMGHGMMGCDRW